MALQIYSGYSPTKLDVDVNQREIKIEITPDLIKRHEKCKRMMAQDVSHLGINTPARSYDEEDENKEEEKSPI